MKSVMVDKELHKALKIASAEAGMTIAAFVKMLFEERRK